MITPTQVRQGQSISRLDLPTLLGKLYTEHLRYDRMVKRRADRLVKKGEAEEKSSRIIARRQIDDRVRSWIGEEKFLTIPLWDYVIEKLLRVCDVDLEDHLGVDVGFKDLLGDYCHAVLKNALSWKEPTRFTAWIARLDQANFGGGLLADLCKLYPRACKRLALPTPIDTGDAASIGAPPVEQDGLRNQVQVNKAVWNYLDSVNDRPGLTSMNIATGLGIPKRDSMVRKSPAWTNYMKKMKKARRVPIEAASGRPDQSLDGQSALDQLIAEENWPAVEREQRREERRQHVSEVPQPRLRRNK